MSRCRLAAATALGGLLLAGCATTEPFSTHLASPVAKVRECAQWFRDLDERVTAAGVADGQDARVPGFPYLRSSRPLAALRPLAAASEPALRALAERMAGLDLVARHHEMANLPEMGGRFGLQLAMERTRDCGRMLRQIDLASAEQRVELLSRAVVPDDYAGGDRFFGLYLLTRIAFASGVRRYEEETRAVFRADRPPAAGASYVRHSPEAGPAIPRRRVADILQRASANPLGLPEPDESHLQDLLLLYAPSFEIEVAADYDRFGEVRWQPGDPAPSVEGARPVVYGHSSWTLYRGRPLLQLVYTLWFSERPPREAGDILAGRLDGVTWRVTLAPDGEPLIYDAMHPCGCFHMFFPTPRARPREAPDGLEEWSFSPQSLPRVREGERPVLRVASGTHYLERISLVRGTDSLARYRIRPYDELRSIQRPDGRRSSIFGPDGLVPGTERAERHLFWPMGIRSAGSMRQWGRHATAFVGRRHFDDADLLEKRFELEL